MKTRFSVFAKCCDGRYFYLNFDDIEILHCLKQIPPPDGLLAIIDWPIERAAEIEFFVELINGNIKYYYLKDRLTEIKETVILDN